MKVHISEGLHGCDRMAVGFKLYIDCLPHDILQKVMKLSVAADKKGNCAGLAVALVPRYCLHHSAILSKHNRCLLKNN
jgi:hypothetical protein